ncbi:MAG: hypothetical protein R3F49_11580 [Planctomycetota bacterium]
MIGIGLGVRSAGALSLGATRLPHLRGHAPTSPAPQAPERSTQVPERAPQAPERSTQVPERSTQVPERSTQVPERSTQVPERSTQMRVDSDAPLNRALMFVAALEAWRNGAVDSPAELRAAAGAMAKLDGRRDALAIAAHYEGLPRAERATGLELERRYEALRERWVTWDGQAAAGVAPPFEALAVPLALDLEALAKDAATARDTAPIARTEALLARLVLTQVEVADATEANTQGPREAGPGGASPARCSRAQRRSRAAARAASKTRALPRRASSHSG